MHHPFPELELIKTAVFTRLPSRFRRPGRNEWTPEGIEMDSEDGLLVCHLGVGVYGFDHRMLPTHLVYSHRACRG